MALFHFYISLICHFPRQGILMGVWSSVLIPLNLCEPLLILHSRNILLPALHLNRSTGFRIMVKWERFTGFEKVAWSAHTSKRFWISLLICQASINYCWRLSHCHPQEGSPIKTDSKEGNVFKFSSKSQHTHITFSTSCPPFSTLTLRTSPISLHSNTPIIIILSSRVTIIGCGSSCLSISQTHTGNTDWLELYHTLQLWTGGLAISENPNMIFFTACEHHAYWSWLWSEGRAREDRYPWQGG